LWPKIRVCSRHSRLVFAPHAVTLAAVRKKRFIRVAVGLVSLALVWFAFLRPLDEPKYQGRYLSEWLVICYHGTNRAEGVRAVQAIGTNALPCFLEWIRYAPSRWQTVVRYKLPSWLEKNRMVGRGLGDRGVRSGYYASLGIGLLGSNAVSAIPELELMMKDRTFSPRVSAAIVALGGIGEPAIPALQAALANATQLNRAEIIWNVRRMALAGHTNTCLPIIVAALEDPDVGVREQATNAVMELAPHLLTNAPAP
jgi:hypothetical protein